MLRNDWKTRAAFILAQWSRYCHGTPCKAGVHTREDATLAEGVQALLRQARSGAGLTVEGVLEVWLAHGVEGRLECTKQGATLFTLCTEALQELEWTGELSWNGPAMKRALSELRTWTARVALFLRLSTDERSPASILADWMSYVVPYRHVFTDSDIQSLVDQFTGALKRSGWMGTLSWSLEEVVASVPSGYAVSAA